MDWMHGLQGLASMFVQNPGGLVSQKPGGLIMPTRGENAFQQGKKPKKDGSGAGREYTSAAPPDSPLVSYFRR